MLQDGQILLDGLPHEYPERIGPAHNGTASRNTCSRTLAGRLFGVSTSTSMPSSFLSLKRIAPMSIIAAHGRAEDTHASHAMAQRNLADTRAVLGQGFGWAHGRSVFPPGTAGRVAPFRVTGAGVAGTSGDPRCVGAAGYACGGGGAGAPSGSGADAGAGIGVSQRGRPMDRVRTPFGISPVPRIDAAVPQDFNAAGSRPAPRACGAWQVPAGRPGRRGPARATAAA